MTQVDLSAWQNTLPPWSSAFGHPDPGQSPFAQLMNDSKQKITEQTRMALYASAASQEEYNQKRQQRHAHPATIQNHCESVNSVGIPSENRQAIDADDFFDDESAEQPFSGQSSASYQHSHQHGRRSEVPESVIPGNKKEIPASAFAGSGVRTTGIQAGAAQMLMPEAAFKKLVRVLRNTSLSKRTSVFLTLDLKELGEAKLDVTLKGKKVFITAYIADRRAAAALSFAISELKRQMADIDLSLEKFEISKGYKRMASVTTGQNGDAAVSVRTGNR